MEQVEQRIERLPLHEAILNRLRDMIIEGHLAPGARLNEGRIGLQLGVSRTPLREAIKSLASEGLVDLVPSRGAVVKTFGAKEIRDMMQVVRMLEQQAGALACDLATDQDIARIRALHDEMLDHYARSDRLAYYKVNQAIHTGIVALGGNEALCDIHARLQTRLKRVRFIGHEGAEKWASAVSEHHEMITALEARDAPRLTGILGRHLNLAWERVKGNIPGAPPGAPEVG